MAKNRPSQTTVPSEVKDYMVSGATFALKWDVDTKAYRTQPKPKDLSPYYDHPDYISHNTQAQGWRAKVYRMVRGFNVALKLKWLQSAVPPGRTLLDYGCGTGDFADVARSESWNVFGLEVNGAARAVAEKRNLTVWKDRQESAKTKYDAITLWHVLEHLEDPVEVKQWIAERLSERGVLIVAVPNHRSWDAQHYKEFWAAYDVPRHLWHFSKESIHAIFEDDFELLQTRPMWFDAIYVSLLSEQYKKNSGSALRGILVGLWSNIRALNTKEPSSLAYVFKKRNSKRFNSK